MDPRNKKTIPSTKRFFINLMNVTIVDYNSGNIFGNKLFKEVAKDKVNIEVTSDLNKIKSSDKVVLPGQGSFKSCVELNKIKAFRHFK